MGSHTSPYDLSLVSVSLVTNTDMHISSQISLPFITSLAEKVR